MPSVHRQKNNIVHAIRGCAKSAAPDVLYVARVDVYLATFWHYWVSTGTNYDEAKAKKNGSTNLGCNYPRLVHMAILSGQRGHNPGPLRAIIGGQPKT